MKFKISKKKADMYEKAKYSLYRNEKFIIISKYGQLKWYLRDIKKCLSLLLEIFMFILFPFCLIKTLLSFIPTIHIIDDKIK